MAMLVGGSLRDVPRVRIRVLKALLFVVAVFVVSLAFRVLEGGFGPSGVNNARAWAQALVVVEAIWMGVLGIRAGLSTRSDHISIGEWIGNALAVILSGAIIAAMRYREVGGHFPTRFDGIVPVPPAWFAGAVGVIGTMLAGLAVAEVMFWVGRYARPFVYPAGLASATALFFGLVGYAAQHTALFYAAAFQWTDLAPNVIGSPALPSTYRPHLPWGPIGTWNGLALFVIASSFLLRYTRSGSSSRLPDRPGLGASIGPGVWRRLAAVRWNYASGILVVTGVCTGYLLATVPGGPFVGFEFEGQALAMAVAGVQAWQLVWGAWLAKSAREDLWKIWGALTGTNLVGLAVVAVGVVVVQILYTGGHLLATMTPWLAEFVGITVGVGAIFGALGIMAGRSWTAKALWRLASAGAMGLGIWTLIWLECATGAGPVGRLVWTPGIVQWPLATIGEVALGYIGMIVAMIRLAHTSAW